LASFYIEKLILIKYLNLYFALSGGIWKLFRFPLGKPPPGLTTPLLPGIWRGLKTSCCK